MTTGATPLGVLTTISSGLGANFGLIASTGGG